MNLISLNRGSLHVEIGSDHGGRIISMTLEGCGNVLYNPERMSGEWMNYGGDFLWIAPQERWNWPPIKEFDQDPWFVSELNKSVLVTSLEWNGIKLRREFCLLSDSTLSVKNYLINLGNKQEWGLWNISQIPLVDSEVCFSANDSDIKVFDYLEDIELEKLFFEGYLAKRGNGIVLTGKLGKDFKIGCITDNPVIQVKTPEYSFRKKFELSQAVDYPHGCNIEFYKNDDYIELEIVWPMTSLDVGEKYCCTQLFELQKR